MAENDGSVVDDAATARDGETARAMIEAGAAGAHFEDQLASVKKCGHMGGKVLVPTREAVQKLVAARLAADVADTPTIVLARTDANAADLLTSDIDEYDAPFITGERSSEGFFRTKAGIDQAISGSGVHSGGGGVGSAVGPVHPERTRLARRPRPPRLTALIPRHPRPPRPRRRLPRRARSSSSSLSSSPSSSPLSFIASSLLTLSLRGGGWPDLKIERKSVEMGKREDHGGRSNIKKKEKVGRGR